MNQVIEAGAPHNPAPTGTVPPTVDAKVEISQKELEDLKHRAEVSSQNFERAKNAETKLKELTDGNADLETVPSEKLQEVQTQLNQVQTQLAETTLRGANPLLNQAWPDFQVWYAKDENKVMPLEAASKVFMAEKGLLEPNRPGLERNTGGPATPPKQGMTAEEAKALREGDGRKYRESLLAGKVQIQN